MSFLQFLTHAYPVAFLAVLTLLLFAARFLVEHFFDGCSKLIGIFSFIVIFPTLIHHGIMPATLMALAMAVVAYMADSFAAYLISSDEFDFPAFWALGGTQLACVALFAMDLGIALFVTYLKFAAFS